MVLAGPTPQTGQVGDVVITPPANAPDPTAIPLQVVAGQYQVQEAQRFGDKISTGALTYQDFNPYESAPVSSRFHTGYGLRRYSDWTPGKAAPGDPQGFVKESSNVDTRHDVAVLSPALHAETLPSSTGPIVWMGELTVATVTLLYAVCSFAGRCIYRRNADGTWTRMAGSTAAAPKIGAVGSFGGHLILGYGVSVNAQYSDDGGATISALTDDAGSPNNIAVTAFTADHATAYIAGGTAADTNISSQVMASLTGIQYEVVSKFHCGDPAWPINGLAPGGGLVQLYVAKQNELGQIRIQASTLSSAALYDVLVPFDSTLSTNGVNTRWWQARGGDEQRGQMALFVNYAAQAHLYTPNSQTAGQIENITPWADPDLRPPNVRGNPDGALGVGAFLYYAISTTAAHTWILARDQRTGATSIYLDLGTTAAHALGYSALYDGGQPYLFLPAGNNVSRVILPQYGEYPADASGCDYMQTPPTGATTSAPTLDLPDIDLGFPSENKVELSLQVVADNLTSARYIRVDYALDGGAFALLGKATVSPQAEILFPDPRPSAKALTLRLTFVTDSATQTPQLRAVVLRCSLNAKLYRLWQFQAYVPGAGTLPADDTRNPQDTLATLWALRAAGTPITFQDRWNTLYTARILQMGEQAAMQEPLHTPETVVALTLLECSGAVLGQTQTNTYQNTQLGSTQGFFDTGNVGQSPINFSGAGPPALGTWFGCFGPSYLDVTDTLANAHAVTVYPVWTVRGPGRLATFINQTTGQQWTLDRDLGAGQVVTIDMDPAHQTVVDQSGTDLSANGSGTMFGIPAGGAVVRPVLYGGNQYSQITVTWLAR